MAPIYEDYPDLRFKDQETGEVFDVPEAYRNPDAGDLGSSSPYRLSDLYPNIAEYRKINTKGFIEKGVMDLEWSRLWTKTWLLAGFTLDVRSPGDWFVYNIGRESFIIVRGIDKKVRAFYNVCKHRGNRLVRGEAGHGLTSFVCGFHSWCWTNTGTNARVTDRDSFAEEVLVNDLDLSQVLAEEVGPFIFISISPAAPPIQAFLQGILPTLASYNISEMRLIKDVTIPMEANWKIAINAFQETYHVHAQHPQTKLTGDDVHIQYDFYPFGHSRMIVPQLIVSPRMIDRETVNDDLRDMLVGFGVDPKEVANAHEARSAVQRKKRNSGITNGIDYSSFTDSQLTDIWSGGIFPNITFSAQPEGLAWLEFLPHPTDPEKCKFHFRTFARGPVPQRMKVLEGKAESTGRAPREKAEAGSSGTYEVVEQDLDAIPIVQEGVRSAALSHIRLSEQEGRVQQFYAELDKYMKQDSLSQ